MTLKTRIYNYIKRHKGEWIASGTIQRLTTEKTNHTAANATRRLRELAEEGKLDVTYKTRNGVRHAYYKHRASGLMTPAEAEKEWEEVWV